MQVFTRRSTPAEIVKVFPKASDLFKENQIDFCCGGDKPLHETFQKQNLDGEIILSVLNEDYELWRDEGNRAKDWSVIPITEMIDHIVQHHHAYLYDELPGISDLVTKIFRVHGADHPHLKDLHRLFNAFRMEKLEHSFKEEREVFPLIIKYGQEPSEELLEDIQIANGELEDEHDHAGNLLKEMRIVTNGFTLPELACSSYRITYARLKELEEKTFQHIHLENNILFKRL